MQLPTQAWIWPILIVFVSLEAQAELNLDKLDMQSQIPEDLLKNTSFNQAKEAFRKKCIEVSGEKNGEQAYADIETGFLTLSECMSNIVNYTTMQKEIQEASPQGELDVVFNKYCAKRSNATECVDAFTSKLVPCLDKKELESLDVIKHIVKSLLNFVCHKDGDQIALFIAEEGFECLESQKDNIHQCFNSTFSTYFDEIDMQGKNKIKTIPKLVVEEKQCGDIIIFENCVVRHLEHCSKITPANLIESMFNFIRNETLCRNYNQMALTGSANAFAHVTHINNILIFTIMIVILFKFSYFK